MQIVEMNLLELKKAEKNVRVHSKKQIAEYQRSLEQFGQTKPIVVDENNVILIGNGLYEAMLGLGFTNGSVMVKAGLTEKEKKKLMIADNRIFSLGIDNTLVIEDLLKELEGDYDVPGYDDELLQQMFADADEITESIQEYGVFEPAQIEQIRSNGEKDAAREEKAAEPIRPSGPVLVGSSPVNTGASVNAQNDVKAPGQAPTGSQAIYTDAGFGSAGETKKSVICPKCGEVIWL